MKFLTKNFLAVLFLAAIAMTSCKKDDGNNEPDKPEPKGTMTGTTVDYSGSIPEQGTWNSTDVSLFQDTLANTLTLTSTNSETGDKLTAIMTYVAVPSNSFDFDYLPIASNVATIEKSGSTAIISTKSNDDPVTEDLIVFNGGQISITTPQFTDSAKVNGFVTLNFVKMNPGTDDDENYIQLGGLMFSDVPLTRGGTPAQGSISCSIDGSAFNPILVQAMNMSGFSIVAADQTGNGLQLSIPEDATVGSHDLDGIEYMAIYSAGLTVYTDNTGTITINAIDSGEGTVSGTFEFEGSNSGGTNTVSVTNGTFSIQ